jgi:hypothetical protein
VATLLAIKQRVVRHFAQQDEALAGLPVPLVSTDTTASGQLTIRDTKLARATTSDANHFDKRHVEIVETVASSPALGTIAVIADGGFDLSEIITVAPAMGAVMQSGTNYIIYPRGLSPDSVTQHINDTLRLTHGPHVWFPSMVTNSDMEDADNLATHFPDVGTPSGTTAYATSADAGFHLFGTERAVTLTQAGTADVGFETGNVTVAANENLLLYTVVSVGGFSIDVVLRRVTATAADLETVTVNDARPTAVQFTTQIPSGCENVRVRYVSNSTGAVQWYVSAPVVLQSTRDHAYVAPSWLTSPATQIIEARSLPAGGAGEVANSYHALTQRPLRDETPLTYRSDRWLTTNYVIVAASEGRPVYFLVKRPYAELSALTDPTNCDEDYLTYSAISRIYDDRGEEEKARKWGLRAAEIARAKGYGTEGFRIVPNPLAVV